MTVLRYKGNVVSYPDEYIPGRRDIHGWEEPYYPEGEAAALALRKFTTVVDHPEGIDSDHAVQIQDAFWRYINRHDVNAYVSYAHTRLNNDRDSQNAFDKIVARLCGERTRDSDPFAGFRELAGRKTCPSCARKQSPAVFVPVFGELDMCQYCAETHCIHPLDDPERWHLSDNCVNLRIPGLAIGLYSHSWANENLYRCRETGTYYLNSEAHTTSRCCADRGKRFIYSYHGTTPIDTHGWPRETPKNSLCFGVELEMEREGSRDRDEDEDTDDEDSDSYQDSQAQQRKICRALRLSDGTDNGGIPGVLGRYVLENDGSLNDTGVELVTCPYTLDFHQKQFGWDKLLAEVNGIAMSGKGTNNCGMHIHVNRKALSPLILGKMLVFVNADSNTRLIRQVAQRSSDRWAERYEKKITDGKGTESDKYQAMHLATNTVEFRIFRGNLRPERVLKNIEFVHSVVMYCKAASMRDLDNTAGYYSWLFKNRGTYRNLVKFLGIADPKSGDV